MSTTQITSNLLITLFLILLSSTALCQPPEPVTGCHCFKNRTYNPLDKFAADEYILATSFNSLLAKYFGISKRQIILMKMQGGTTQNDLIIGLSLSKSSGLPLQNLLELRESQMSWQQVITNPIFSGQPLSSIMASLKTGTPAAQASREINNTIIALFFNTPSEFVDTFSIKGFSEKEITLIFILASISKLKPEEIAFKQNQEGKSWSEIANSLGIEPASVGKAILSFTKN